MSRVLKMLVYGVIVCAQLGITLFVLAHYTRSAVPAAPGHGASAESQVMRPSHISIGPVLAMLPASLSIPKESAFGVSTTICLSENHFARMAKYIVGRLN